MGFTKITSDDIQNKGVTGLPDTPNLSTAEMQQKFDELSLDVLIPRLNALIDELENVGASKSLGAEVPEGIVADGNIQAIIDALSVIVQKCSDLKHEHKNKEILDGITVDVIIQITNVINVLGSISAVSQIVNGKEDQLPSCKAISEYVQEMGGGDMTRATYDNNRNGIVDNAEALGGEPKEYYQAASDDRLMTSAKDIVGAINEVNGKEVEVLDTRDEILENTSEGKVAGALPVKEVIDNLGGLSFYEDETGKYVVGADAVPKKLGSGNLQRYIADSVSYSVTGNYQRTFDLSAVCENYQNLTLDNILGGLNGAGSRTNSSLIRSGSASFAGIDNYDQSTGIITYTITIYSQNGNCTVSATPCFYICS